MSVNKEVCDCGTVIEYYDCQGCEYRSWLGDIVGYSYPDGDYCLDCYEDLWDGFDCPHCGAIQFPSDHTLIQRVKNRLTGNRRTKG